MNTSLHHSISKPLSLTELIQKAPATAAFEPSTTVSSRYGFISTAHVVEALIGQGLQPYAVQQSRTNKPDGSSYAKHLIRFRSPLQTELNKVGDNYPELVVLNSHNGLSSYRVYVGIFRLVCTNGLIVQERSFGSAIIRHSHDVIEKVIEATTRAVHTFPQLAETINRWQQVGLSLDQQTELAQRALGLRWTPEEAPIKAPDLLAPRRSADQGNDLWRVFNRVQENLEKGGIQYEKGVTTQHRPRRNTTRQVTGVDANVDLNTGLWALAAEYA